MTFEPRVGPRVGPRETAREDPRRLIFFPVFSPSRTPHESSHESEVIQEPLHLKPRILAKKSALLVKRKNHRPRQGTEICNFGAPSPLEALLGFLAFSPVSMCNLVRRAPYLVKRKNGFAKPIPWTENSIAARGAEQEGRNPAQGSRGFRAPRGPRKSTPRFRNSGSRKPLPRGPLEPRKGSQGLGRGSSGASERCVRFQKSGERRWAVQRPLRGPVFPDAPEGVSNSRVPTFGPQIKKKTLVKIRRRAF